MIIVEVRERIVVLKGWRAWLLATAALVAGWVLFAMIAFIVLGAAITAAAMLLLIIPAALAMFGLQVLLGRRRS